MDEQRDKLPESEPASIEPSEKDPKAGSRLPEEAGEVYELVDEEVGGLPPRTPPASEAGDEALREIRSLRAKLDHKDRQIEQVMEAYRSKKAETEKLRKRIEKTERRKFEQSKGDFIARFVEVLDNLDRAIDSIENAFDPDSVLQGIMLVRSRLVQLLKEEGLEKIFVRGQGFDPAHSEAAGMEEVADASMDGVVLRELQPGYMLKGSLLRVARVVVGKHEGAPAEVEPVPEGPSKPAEEIRMSAVDAEADPAAPHGDRSWETDAAGQDLEFTEDGFDFSNE